MTPKGADGAPCDWDERDGCWRESDGAPFDPKRAAARKKARQREAQSEASKRADRVADAAAKQAMRANLPAEQTRADRVAHAAAEQERRANLTAEQTRADRDAHAAAEQARRAMLGWTPLKQAISLPTGACEQQLLFDTHGCGSAFFTVNSRRLRTLKEGGALHAECVEDTAKDVQLLCPVDVLDEYRMVKAFVERKEEAEKLHVCATCGALLASKHARCPLEPH